MKFCRQSKIWRSVVRFLKSDIAAWLLYQIYAMGTNGKFRRNILTLRANNDNIYLLKIQIRRVVRVVEGVALEIRSAERKANSRNTLTALEFIGSGDLQKPSVLIKILRKIENALIAESPR